jgi:hypothetical protein
MIIVRFAGVLTPAEEHLVKIEGVELSKQVRAKLLTDYYNGMLEGFYVPLEEAIREIAQLALVEKQAVLEFEQEQCVFLLTLGTKPESCGQGA